MQAKIAYFYDSRARVVFPACDRRVYRTPALELISFICKCSLHDRCKRGVIRKCPITCTTLHENLAFANESILVWIRKTN